MILVHKVSDTQLGKRASPAAAKSFVFSRVGRVESQFPGQPLAEDQIENSSLSTDHTVIARQFVSSPRLDGRKEDPVIGGAVRVVAPRLIESCHKGVAVRVRHRLEGYLGQGNLQVVAA